MFIICLHQYLIYLIYTYSVHGSTMLENLQTEFAHSSEKVRDMQSRMDLKENQSDTSISITEENRKSELENITSNTTSSLMTSFNHSIIGDLNVSESSACNESNCDLSGGLISLNNTSNNNSILHSQQQNVYNEGMNNTNSNQSHPLFDGSSPPPIEEHVQSGAQESMNASIESSNGSTNPSTSAAVTSILVGLPLPPLEEPLGIMQRVIDFVSPLIGVCVVIDSIRKFMFIFK